MYTLQADKLAALCFLSSHADEQAAVGQETVIPKRFAPKTTDQSEYVKQRMNYVSKPCGHRGHHDANTDYR
jgi:hypothetical protein